MPRLRKVNAHTTSEEMVKHLKEELQKLKAQYESGGGDPDLHDEIKERFARTDSPCDCERGCQD